MWIKVLWSIFIFYAFTKIGSYNIGIVFLLFFEIPNDAFTTLSQFSSLPVITQSRVLQADGLYWELMKTQLLPNKCLRYPIKSSTKSLASGLIVCV